jgi:hypothetical protein
MGSSRASLSSSAWFPASCRESTRRSRQEKLVSFITTPGLVFVEPCRAVQRLLDPDETQQILTESMAKALDRSIELDSISSKSKDLFSKSGEFRARATDLKWTMRRLSLSCSRGCAVGSSCSDASDHEIVCNCGADTSPKSLCHSARNPIDRKTEPIMN